jgi:hypothetical protein
MKLIGKFTTALALCCFVALGSMAHAQQGDKKQPPPKDKVYEVDNPPKKDTPRGSDDKKKNDDKKKDDRKPPLISYLRRFVQ